MPLWFPPESESGSGRAEDVGSRRHLVGVGSAHVGDWYPGLPDNETNVYMSFMNPSCSILRRENVFFTSSNSARYVPSTNG